MIRSLLTARECDASLIGMKKVAVMGACLAFGSLAGCVEVNAPDKPIEINLNINIRQEVVVRLQQDARELIEENEEIF